MCVRVHARARCARLRPLGDLVVWRWRHRAAESAVRVGTRGERQDRVWVLVPHRADTRVCTYTVQNGWKVVGKVRSPAYVGMCEGNARRSWEEGSRVSSRPRRGR
eukprot:1477481-Pleurochrysis_carterae.AAC.2